jgi:multiple sugar transport system substrate-binding protein
MAKTLKIWIGGQVAELDQTWDDIISKYEKESGNEVEVQLFGFDVYYDKLLAALEAGFGPDLAFADLGGWVPTFAAKDWLVNLDSQIESWDGTDQIWPNLWPTVAYEGSLYGLPWYTDCRLLLYNKTMLKDAGFDNPPETWEEFCYVADKITDSSKRTYGYGVSGTKSEVTTLGYMMFLRIIQNLHSTLPKV